MTTAARFARCVLLVALLTGCSGATPSSPTTTGPAAPAAAPVPAPTPVPAVLPPLSGSFQTFTFERELSSPVQAYTKGSHYLLYDNGAFVLRYQSSDYRGSYTAANGVVTFDWGGAWTASGIVQGDSLTVRYNVRMKMDDFEDAVYVKVQ